MSDALVGTEVMVFDNDEKFAGIIREIDYEDEMGFYKIYRKGDHDNYLWYGKDKFSNVGHDIRFEFIESEEDIKFKFKEGDKVISNDSTMGEGVVREVRVDSVIVDFKNGYTGAYYDLSGKRQMKCCGSDTIKLMEEDMVKFKIGDKIQLKKDFYTIPYFKKLSRLCRKYIAGLKDKTIIITNTEKDDGFCDIFISGYTSLIGSSDSTWTNSCMFELISEVKEVKRPAQAGEYIKIVDREFTYNDYYIVDDICEVVRREDSNPLKAVYAKTRGTHPCNCGDNTSYIFDSEYVVLENYKPETFSINSDEIEAESFEKKDDEVKLPNEKFGFKIGEEVMNNGTKRVVLAFDSYGDEYIYLSDDDKHTSDRAFTASLNDRPVPDFWVYESIERISHIIKPEIGMYARVMTTVNVMDNGQTISLSPYKTGDVFKINSVYSDEQWLTSDDHPYTGVKLTSCELLPYYVPPVKMRTWTEEEIAEAKCIIAEEIMANIGKDIVLAELEDKNFSVRILNEKSWETKIRTSKKCKTDEYNEYIGAMVAICHATGRILPKWINRR